MWIAATLRRSKRSVLESLKRTRSSGTKIIHRNEARTWSMDVLPRNILTALEDAASRQNISVDAPRVAAAYLADRDTPE